MSVHQQIISNPPPIFMIGAGGIVNSAHLPAYRIAGFSVTGIYDIDIEKARTTASTFGISNVYNSIGEMISSAPNDIVYDIAVPAAALIGILEQLPDGTAVLFQKPMGENYSDAKRILALSKKKKLTAAVNFQLRYAPFITELRNIMKIGGIGNIVDLEMNINVYTPWHLWDFLSASPRVEILYHSIHYIDLARNLLGNPQSIYAKTVKHPLMKELASVRSNIIMDYGDMIRVSILTNHCHVYGSAQEQSYIKVEGTNGAVKIGLGLLKNYPTGMPDTFEYITKEADAYTEWKPVNIEGTWFPHAFTGSMNQLMLAARGEIATPDNSVDDAIHTMACVEAAYQSSEQGGVKPLS